MFREYLGLDYSYQNIMNKQGSILKNGDKSDQLDRQQINVGKKIGVRDDGGSRFN